MEKHNHIINLFHKYLENQITRDEMEELMHYFENPKDRDELTALINAEMQDKDSSENAVMLKHMIEGLDQRVFAQTRPTEERASDFERKGRLVPLFWTRGVAVVLIVLILSMGGVWYLQHRNTSNEPKLMAETADIGPGGNHATLMIDGKRVELNADQEGVVVNDNRLSYTDGTAVGVFDNRDQAALPQYVTLVTPKGGQYHVVLSDGTKVWLNAASSLYYPIQFAGEKREVELLGEGYFEVAKNDEMPFVVKSKEQVIHVLGTTFNVNAYDEEGAVATTLVEGRVGLSSVDAVTNGQSQAWSTELAPGHQAINRDGQIDVIPVDVADYMGWKEGRFIFNRIPLSVALRQIERWYDVYFEHGELLDDPQLWGTLSRDVMLSEILEVLEMNTSLKFKREGRRVFMSIK